MSGWEVGLELNLVARYVGKSNRFYEGYTLRGRCYSDLLIWNVGWDKRAEIKFCCYTEKKETLDLELFHLEEINVFI